MISARVSHFACCLSIIAAAPLLAQPARDWDKTYGTWNWEELHLVIPSGDGGYLVGGNTTANGGDVSGTTFGLNDFWLLKTDANGNKIWDKTYGGSANDLLWDILALPDGGYLLGGTSESEPSGNKTAQHFGKRDFWLVKINAEGQKIWDKSYGGSERDELFKLAKSDDNQSFMLGGWTNSGASGVKKSDSLGVYDVWILRVDTLGNLLSQNQFGGSELDNLYDLVATPDGGFLAGGASASNITSTKSQACWGLSDFWVIKLDSAANQVWDVRFGGTNVEQIEQILPLLDGNYLLVGASMSPTSGDKTAPNYGSFDKWLVKMRPDGSRIWDKSFGGSSFDGAYQVVETPEGNLLVGGTTASGPGGTKKTPAYGYYDFWLNHLDPDGNLIWEKTYGGSKNDALTALLQNPTDGSLLLAGHSASPKSAFKSENSKGYNDFWLLKTWCGIKFKLPADTTLCSSQKFPISIFPKNCANGDCEMAWSEGSTGNEIEYQPDSTGLLFVVATDANSCRLSDTLRYQFLPGPAVALPADTTIFETGSQLLLNAKFSDQTIYEWNTGSTAPSIVVSTTGKFSVTLTTDNGCSASDDIEVCACGSRDLFIPNVFQPNLNVLNDIWYIHARPGAVERIERLQVFDRWGHRVFLAEKFQPNDKTFAWDGMSAGKWCAPGVYTYALEILYPLGIRERLFGTVTLLR